MSEMTKEQRKDFERFLSWIMMSGFFLAMAGAWILWRIGGLLLVVGVVFMWSANEAYKDKS